MTTGTGFTFKADALGWRLTVSAGGAGILLDTTRHRDLDEATDDGAPSMEASGGGCFSFGFAPTVERPHDVMLTGTPTE